MPRATTIAAAFVVAGLVLLGLAVWSWPTGPSDTLPAPRVLVVEPSKVPVQPSPTPAPQPTAAVSGKVVDGGAGAVVKLDAGRQAFAAQTRRGGRFELDVPLGRHVMYTTLLVGNDEILGPPVLVEVAPEGLSGVELTLPPAGHVGIGLVLAARGSDVVVTWSQEDRAAYAAGVRADDRLLAIDGVELDRMGIREAERLLQGPSNSTVRLELRPSGEAPTEIVVTR